MSLILEALRKSEAQRRLGQAPDLHSPVVAATPRGRVPRWLLPALALMLVGAGAWWLGRMAVPDPSNGTATEAVVDPVVLPIEVGEGPATGRGDATPDVSRATPAPDIPVAPPPSPRPAPQPVPAPAPVTTAAQPARPQEPVAAPAPAPSVSRQADVVAQPPAQAALQAPEAGPAAPAPAPQAAADTEEGLLHLSDLPAATRATLPELRISMHVFAEDPSRRFAIIDGRRVGEGGLLEGQGVVEAIRRDGIVVDFNGRRVLLPRP